MFIAAPLFANCLFSVVVPSYYAVAAQEQHANKDERGEGDQNEHGEQDEHGEHGGEEEEVITLTASERQKAGIVTAPVTRRSLTETIAAPGEVTINRYATSQITSRIAAQVITRHVRMGAQVETGRGLVTLSSVQMAEAQGGLILAEKEWARTQTLGRDVVSAQHFLEARIGAEQARAKVLAYGMTETQLSAMIKSGKLSTAAGRFDLVATQAGTILSDEFIVGQFVEPGDPLFTIGDENRIWVEAQLQPGTAARVKSGAPAWITKGGLRVEGVVIQVHHMVDEKTRTLAVRIEVDNSADTLHPGEFVDVAIATQESSIVTAAPNSAILLLEGQQIVFKLEGDELHPTAVETGITRGGWTEVLSGLVAGDEIVTAQAFLIKSLILKTKMGSGHGH